MTKGRTKISATDLVAHDRITPGQVTMPSGDVRPMNSYERSKVRRYLNRSGLRADEPADVTSAG